MAAEGMDRRSIHRSMLGLIPRPRLQWELPTTAGIGSSCAADSATTTFAWNAGFVAEPYRFGGRPVVVPANTTKPSHGGSKRPTAEMSERWIRAR